MSVQNIYNDFNIERMTVDWLGWGVAYKESLSLTCLTALLTVARVLVWCW